MRSLVKTYTFDADAGTVTLDDFGPVRADRLLLVVDATTGDTLYVFNSDGSTVTAAGNVFTLSSVPAGVASDDDLLVFYEGLPDDPVDHPAQPVSVEELPLPAGAATEATLVSIDGHVDGVEGALSTIHADLGSIDGHVDGVEGALSTIHADLGSIDGHVDGVEAALATLVAYAGTPTLPADSATETTLGQIFTAVDATATNGATAAGQATAIAGLVSIDGHVDGLEALATSANTKLDQVHTDLTGTLAVSAAALPLPTGAATSAKQDTQAGKLDTLHTDLGHLTDGTQTTAVTQATAANLNAQVVGTVASGSADSGNPVKVGARYNSTKPTLTDGTRGDLQMGSRGALGVQLFAFDGASGVATVSTADAVSAASIALATTGFGVGYNGSTWDRLRTPAVFKTVAATASGDTALWTPTTGKKFRVLAYKVEVTGNAATAGGGVITIALRDSSTAVGLTHSVFVPSAAGSAMGAEFNSGWITLGNGVLSAAANNVLNVNLSAALSAGNVRVIVIGTEE